MLEPLHILRKLTAETFGGSRIPFPGLGGVGRFIVQRTRMGGVHARQQGYSCLLMVRVARWMGAAKPARRESAEEGES